LQATQSWNQWGGTVHQGNQTSRKNLDEINEGLFGNLADEEDEPTYREMREYLLGEGFTYATLNGLKYDGLKRNYELIKNRESNIPDDTEPNISQMIDYLVTKDWERRDLVQLKREDISHMYWTEKLDDDDFDEYEATMQEMLDFLVQEGFNHEDIKTWSDDEITSTYDTYFSVNSESSEPTENEMKLYLRKIGFTDIRLELMSPDILKSTFEANKTKKDDETSYEAIIDALVQDNIMTEEKLKKLSRKELVDIAETVYGPLELTEGEK
jgi:hypothetical protein